MFEEILQKVARQFAKDNIPYMVMGGQAVLIYGEPRLTRDIDITLGMSIDKLNMALKTINQLGFKALVENVSQFVRETMVLPVIDENSGVRIDLIFSFSPFERQAVQRAKSVKIGNTDVKFVTLEDLVIHKLFAGRARDLDDVFAVLLKNPNYDEDYILKWLKEFDLISVRNLHEIFQKIKRKINC